MNDFKELAKREGAKFIQRCPDWDGKEIWQLLYDDPDGETPKVGIPILAVNGPNGAKLMSDAEFEDYLKYVSAFSDLGEKEEPEIEEID